ncbi:hypothetical protein NIES4101_32380 [Calothrix sp. NIES-4101]|nr:hypothetical protein NIES4101_32380 [Calothrix sp. NIES-4101]
MTKLFGVQKRRINIPKNIGNNTIWIVVIIKDNGFISIQVEARNQIQRGVIIGLSNVETVVKATDKATSPRAKKVTTLEAVPPGLAPLVRS